MGKDEQLRRLTSIGLSTPRTAILSPTSLLEPKEWGEYVIVKPNNSNGGKGVKLVRTIDLSPRYEELVGFADDRFLVQQFIDHSEDGYPTAYRVLTLFGRALYCTSHRWGTRRPPLAEIAANPLGEIASNTKRMGGRVHAICNDTDIIALGERAHQAFPECPLLESMSFAKGRAGTSWFWRSILMGLFGIFLHPCKNLFAGSCPANAMRSSTPWIEPPTC